MKSKRKRLALKNVLKAKELDIGDFVDAGNYFSSRVFNFAKSLSTDLASSANS